MIEKLRSDHCTKQLCKAFDCSSSGVYKARRASIEPGPRATANQELLGKIREKFKGHRCRYGSPRITTELKLEKVSCSVNRVARLMRLDGLVGISPKRKHPQTTDSEHGGPIAPNLLKSLKIEHPNQAWAMDITYLKAGGDWVYLAAVLDMFTRKIVGWQIAEHMRSELVEDALRNAVKSTNPRQPVIIHSDRGSQYASGPFIELADDLKFVRSMSAKGNCYDNATMESFFGTLKREEYELLELSNLQDARAVVFGYIERYYNTQRLHTSLGMSPASFIKQWLEGNEAPSAEFAEASESPMVEKENDWGEKHPSLDQRSSHPAIPSEVCSPASPPSVSLSNHSCSTIVMDVHDEIN